MSFARRTLSIFSTSLVFLTAPELWAQTIGRQGVDGSKQTICLYSKGECDQLNGNHYPNGECLKKEGGSFSWDFRSTCPHAVPGAKPAETQKTIRVTLKRLVQSQGAPGPIQSCVMNVGNKQVSGFHSADVDATDIENSGRSTLSGQCLVTYDGRKVSFQATTDTITIPRIEGGRTCVVTPSTDWSTIKRQALLPGNVGQISYGMTLDMSGCR